MVILAVSETTMVGALLGALGVLASVIVYLWKRQEATQDKTRADLDDCLERERKRNEQAGD